MTIFVKNKHTLQIDEFKFKCCIGKKGSTETKKKVIKKHQRVYLKLKSLFQERSERKTINCTQMYRDKKSMGWCNDVRFPKI